MRGNVLNRKGMYNRWKLTRLLLDLDWEKKVWEESWQTRKVAEGEEGGDEQEERAKPKRGRGEGGSRKRAKLDAPDDQVWGEVVSQRTQARVSCMEVQPALGEQLPSRRSG